MSYLSIIKDIHFVEVETEDGIFKRQYDQDTNMIIWFNDFKQYEYDEKTQSWKYYTKRKGYVESIKKLWLETMYQRKRKFINIIKD